MKTPNNEGVTKERQLMQVEKTIGHAPPELTDFRRCMTEMQTLKVWRLFWEIRSGIFESQPITWTELQAFFTLTGKQHYPYRVKLLKMMDSVYLNSIGVT